MAALCVEVCIQCWSLGAPWGSLCPVAPEGRGFREKETRQSREATTWLWGRGCVKAQQGQEKCGQRVEPEHSSEASSEEPACEEANLRDLLSSCQVWVGINIMLSFFN